MNQYPDCMLLFEDFKSFSIYYCGSPYNQCVLYKVPTWQYRLKSEWKEIKKYLSFPCFNYNFRQNGEMIINHTMNEQFYNDEIVNDLIEYVYKSDLKNKYLYSQEIIITLGKKLKSNHLDKILNHDSSVFIADSVMTHGEIAGLSLETMIRLNVRSEKHLEKKVMERFKISSEDFKSLREKNFENKRNCDI